MFYERITLSYLFLSLFLVPRLLPFQEVFQQSINIYMASLSLSNSLAIFDGYFQIRWDGIESAIGEQIAAFNIQLP